MADFEYVDVNGRQIRVRPRETAQEIDEYGNFHRQPNRFTEGFGEGKNPVEKDRYILFWAKGCNWSNRAAIARELGSILTFEVDSKERAYHILENVKLIQFAESLGGTETLITYPITQTHSDLSKEELDRNGITDRILRLSVGIEGAEDLIADLEAVLK